MGRRSGPLLFVGGRPAFEPGRLKIVCHVQRDKLAAATLSAPVRVMVMASQPHRQLAQPVMRSPMRPSLWILSPPGALQGRRRESRSSSGRRLDEGADASLIGR